MVDDIVKDYQRKNNDGVRNFLANIGVVHLVIFVFIIGVIIYMSSQKNLDPKWNILMYCFLGGVILMLYFKPNKNRRLLPIDEVIKIADSTLKKMVREGDCFPFDSKVYLTGKFDLKSRDDIASGKEWYTHYELGFVEMKGGSQFKKDNIIKIDCYEGTSLGIHDAPLGFSGNETASTIKTVPVAVFQGNIGSEDIGKNGNVRR